MNKIDYQERYDALVKTIVMAGDLLICNLLFMGLAVWMGFPASLGIAVPTATSAVYFGCTIKGGIILHKKKVRNSKLWVLYYATFSIFPLPQLYC